MLMQILPSVSFFVAPAAGWKGELVSSAYGKVVASVMTAVLVMRLYYLVMGEAHRRQFRPEPATIAMDQKDATQAHVTRAKPVLDLDTALHAQEGTAGLR